MRSLFQTALLGLSLVSLVPAVSAQELTERRRIDIARRLQETAAVVSVGRSSGSGFLVGPEHWIVTNAHVVRGFEQAAVTVRLRNADDRRARVLAYDPQHDLAIVEAEGTIDVEPLPLGDPDAVEVGQNVLAFGSPFGLEGTLTQGIVSARRDLPGIGGGAVTGLIQTDAPINPGNSGGPLVDSSGRIIGVNTAILSRGGGSNGIGFAVPVSYVEGLLGELRENLAARRRQAEAPAQPQAQPAPSAAPVWFGILGEDFASGGYYGVRVRQVVPGGPAASAGIVGSDDRVPDFVRQLGVPWTGHIILGIDGRAVRRMADLQQLLAAHRPGDRVTVAITVGPGVVHGETTVQLVAPPQAPAAAPRTHRRRIRVVP